MTRQQRRKMERNSKKKQTSMTDVLSISMVDTKSIFENKCQFISTGEEAIKNYLKKNQRLMETNVLVNFGFDTQINFGIISIIHDCLKDLDVENLIK